MWDQNPERSLKGKTEKEIIHRIATILGSVSPTYPRGIGDDCAVVPNSLKYKNSIATTDSIILGKHFTEETEGGRVGSKLLNRNLSDLAAMGGRPDYALLNIITCPSLSLDWFDAFITGLRSAALNWNLEIVGGDLCSNVNRSFIANLSMIGSVDNPTLRKGSSPGDFIVVTGQLGGSLLGKHLDFNPRIPEGIWLNNRKEVSSMMDITDGLAKDLPSLLKSSCGAIIDQESIPIAEDAFRISANSNRTPLDHALTDGEDYELLFTLKESTNWKNFKQEWSHSFSTPIHSIGRVAEENIFIDKLTKKRIFAHTGYEHF